MECIFSSMICIERLKELSRRAFVERMPPVSLAENILFRLSFALLNSE